MSYYIFSTLANTQKYTLWDIPEDKNMLPKIRAEILIKGGAGVSKYKTFVTSKGVVTEVTDEQFAELEKNHDFQRHVKAGHIQIEKKNYNVEKIAQDMARDKSAPITPDNYKSRVAVLPGTDEDERPTPLIPKKAA